MIVLKRPYVSYARTRFLCVPARSPHPSSPTAIHAQKWKIWLPGWICAADSEKMSDCWEKKKGVRKSLVPTYSTSCHPVFVILFHILEETIVIFIPE